MPYMKPELKVFPNGSKEWTLNGKFHREDGPAFIYLDGTEEEWWLNGRLHREDGPAIIHSDGTTEWWYKGEQYFVKSFEEFLVSIVIKR